MKKFKVLKTLGVFFTAATIMLGFPSQTVKADNASAYTYTVSETGMWSRTQDAYLTGGVLFKDMGLNQPEDLFIKNEKIYIADSKNGRILVVDQSTNQSIAVGEGVLTEPTGVFAYDNGDILVADYGASKVALFDKEGNLIRWYERPDSPVFGKSTTFNPRKVIGDDRGNIYIVSEGSYDGIVQISKDGEFIGYFGDNNTKLSIVEAIQNIIFTDEQKAKLFNRIPRTFYNLDMDEKGMLYTVTQGSTGDALKKHSIAGTNILNLKKTESLIFDETNFADVAVANNNQIYAVTATGLIYEYDTYGNVVFSFGGAAISSEKSGLLSVASAIEVDDKNYLYVLDKERGVVQVFYPTEFAEMTHEALAYYDQGKYDESKALWTEILKLSGSAKIAHNGLGKTYFQEKDYDKALEHFKAGNNRKDYSDAFWEVRNNALQNNGTLIISLVVALYIVYILIKFLDKKLHILNPFRNFGKFLGKYKFLRDIGLLKTMLKHPVDSMYYLRRGRHGSITAATVIYLIAFAIFVANMLYTGFIFRLTDARNVSKVFMIVQFFGPITLAVMCNYLVSSINEGIGKVRDVYCLIAYSFAPYIIFMPFLILLTYILTANEAFIISFGTTFIIAWCLSIFFIGLKEVHNYEVGDVIKNILLTIFLMAVVVIVGSILYMFWDVLIEFIYSVVKELAYNVRK